MKIETFLAIFGICILSPTLSATADASDIPQGPAGAAFYLPPDLLPEGRRGDVIQARALADDRTMALPGAERTSLVLYRGLSDRDAPIAVSGTVSIPKGQAPEGGWPVIVWSHGTSGLNPRCAPSLDTAKGPEHGYVQAMATLLDGFVEQGYAVVASDYQGLGVAGFQPFLQGVPTGRSALDMLTAGRQVEPALGQRYVVMGHSQGGQVDLFAAAMATDYLPDERFLGTVAFAPASHFAQRLDMVRKAGGHQPALAYILYILHSFATTDPGIDLGDILAPEAIARLSSLHDDCVTKATTTGYWTGVDAAAQFLEDPDLAAFRAFAAKNEPGRLKIDRPVMVVQGSADHTVLPEATDATVRQLCENGNRVNYQVFAKADHRGAMRYGAEVAHKRVADLFTGNPVQGNCDNLPRAAVN